MWYKCYNRKYTHTIKRLLRTFLYLLSIFCLVYVALKEVEALWSSLRLQLSLLQHWRFRRSWNKIFRLGFTKSNVLITVNILSHLQFLYPIQIMRKQLFCFFNSECHIYFLLKTNCHLINTLNNNISCIDFTCKCGVLERKMQFVIQAYINFSFSAGPHTVTRGPLFLFFLYIYNHITNNVSINIALFKLVTL